MKVFDIRLTIQDDVDEEALAWLLGGQLIHNEDRRKLLDPMIKGISFMVENNSPEFKDILTNDNCADLERRFAIKEAVRAWMDSFDGESSVEDRAAKYQKET